MKSRIAVASLTFALVATLFVPTLLAGGRPGKSDAKRVVRMEGWVVDSVCGRKNANAESAACVRECIENGAQLVFIDMKGNRYDLSEQEKGLEVIGQQVKLFGTLSDDRVLTIGKFILPKGGAQKIQDLGGQSSMKPNIETDRRDRGGDQ